MSAECRSLRNADIPDNSLFFGIEGVADAEFAKISGSTAEDMVVEEVCDSAGEAKASWLDDCSKFSDMLDVGLVKSSSD